MNSVGIQSFAASCALGQTPQEIWRNASQGSTAGMVFDDKFLFEGSTYLGHAHHQPLKLNPYFDCRVNQLLARVAQDLDSDYLADMIAKAPHRVGVILGTSTSSVDELEGALKVYDQTQQWPESYQIHAQRMANVAEFLADYLGTKGPVMSVSTACSSSAKAILSAKRWLNQGLCDVVITGGVDILCQLTINGFNALGALSAEKTLPFSQNRNGINIGEAAALFVLSNDSTKLNICGGGESSDAHHISAPDPSGQGAMVAMQRALNDAGLKAEEIDYVNLHGTGTAQNDAMEALAVNTVFGPHKTCGSSKAMTGHTLGAAGALELALCALSMSDHNQTGDFMPHIYDGEYDPTIKPLNLALINNQLGKPKFALSNSFAFGGSNAAVIIGRNDD